MRYRVREGAVLSHHGRIYKFPEVVDDIPKHVAEDPAVVGCLELMAENTPVTPAETKKGDK